MFKRLSKARRHSSGEIGSTLSNQLTLNEPAGATRKSTEDQLSSLNDAFLYPTRSKYTRKSCGDAASYSLLASEDISLSSKIQPETMDYQMVTAMPAFIVEHEPEKQRSMYYILKQKTREMRSREQVRRVASLSDLAGGQI